MEKYIVVYYYGDCDSEMQIELLSVCDTFEEARMSMEKDYNEILEEATEYGYIDEDGCIDECEHFCDSDNAHITIDETDNTVCHWNIKKIRI